MSTMHSEERIGEAWRQHRMNNNPAAIEIFQEILNSDSKDIDALYGLGLAQRANGENGAAIESFQQALKFAQEGLEEVVSTSEGFGSGNNLNTDQDDRFMMISRMLKQRLVELGQ